MKPLAPNTMIQSRYLIVQPIGKGGMGEVYLAVDQRLGSAVALKRTFFKEDDTLANAFEREARILARLRHPVLPKVIDHFMENGDQFLVMEHISGDDLAKRLENANKPFPLSWVMFWADQMLDALSYLHSHEPPIIHRDIKPQNMKLTDENHIVLLDFGLSKDFETGSSSQPLNSASVVGYSPHFASMEQVRGTGTDARSDLYSLSATLYQLMTNTIPADSLSRADAMLGAEKDPVLPINEINPEVPPAVSEVIFKGLALRQDERFSTAVEMQKALRRAFNQGKADADNRSVRTDEELPASEARTKAPPSDASEMATRMRTEPGMSTMDATIQMEVVPEVLPEIVEVQQSEVKTEIFTPVDVAVSDSVPQVEPTPDVGQAPPSVEPPPPVAAAAAAGSTAPSTPFTVQVPEHAPPPRKVADQPEKKSGGGLLIGGLIGLVVLAGVGGGGWFAYNKYFAAAKPTSTPVPASNASPLPSPVVAVGTDQNTNTRSDQVTVANTDEANSNRTVSSTSPADNSVTKTTSPGTTKQPPVKTTQPQTTKATPKPKQKDDRTVILQ